MLECQESDLEREIKKFCQDSFNEANKISNNFIIKSEIMENIEQFNCFRLERLQIIST